MNNTVAMALVLLLGWAETSARAADMTDQQARSFLNSKGCNGCHAVDEVHLAPSFVSVSSRYAGAKEPQIEVLAQKILDGGAGNWGVVPMVSNPRVTPQEARSIVIWILTLNARKGQ